MLSGRGLAASQGRAAAVADEVPCPDERGQDCDPESRGGEDPEREVARMPTHKSLFAQQAGEPACAGQAERQPRKASSKWRSASGDSDSGVSRPVSTIVWRICSR